ncbi:MAG TPA: hypothetical protein P5528_01705 [Steroidobacteraceae bacterium]|nr:hypothetical protein [Steroidobacteraceae bacterium]
MRPPAKKCENAAVRRPTLILALLLPIAAILLLVDWTFPFTAMWRVVEDFGHAPLFGVIALALLGVSRSRWPSSVVRQYGFAAVTAAVLGMLTELAQVPVGRDASWGDLSRNFLGIGIALAAFAAFDRRLAIPRSVRVLLVLTAATGLVWTIAPVVEVVQAYRYRTAIFPLLADFSQSSRDSYWSRGSGARRTFENGALRVDFVSEPFPGVAWFEPRPDWRGYDQLVVDVENPNDSLLQLTLRVHDRAHSWEFADRFNRNIRLAPRERRLVRVPLNDIIRAPSGRDMDMGHIADVSLYRSDPAGPSRMIVHSLRLEKEEP